MCNWEDFYEEFEGQPEKDEMDWRYGTAGLDNGITAQPVADPGATYLYTPLHATTPAGHVALLRHASQVEHTGVLYCMSFYFAVSDRNAGALSLFYYYLRDAQVGYDYKLAWSSMSPAVSFDAGMWVDGQIVLDEPYHWTV